MSVEDLHDTKFFKSNLFKISISRMLAFGAEQLAWPFFSLYVLELGGSIGTIALISSIGSIASVLFTPIGGYIADSKGRVKLLFLGTLSYSLCSIFFIFANSWVVLAIGVFIQLLTRMYMPALDAILADSISRDKRGRGYAISDSIMAIPAIFAPFFIGFLANKFSINYAVKIGFTGLLIFGSIAAFIRLSIKETIVSDKEPINLKYMIRFIYDSYKKVFSLLKGKWTNLKAIIIICITCSFFNAIVGPYWIVYATEVIKLTTVEWGIIISSISLMRLTLLIPFGLFVDKIGSKKAILISLLPLPLCSFLFINSQAFISTFIIIIIISLCNTLITPASSALFANSTDKRSRGSVISAISRGRMGLMLGSGFLGGGIFLLPAKLIGYKIGEFLYQRNSSHPWLILSIGLIIIFTLNTFLINESEIEKKET